MRVSLRARIMICCICLVALLDVIVVVFVRDKLSDVLIAEYIAHGRTTAESLAARSEHFVLTQEYVSLMQLVKDLRAGDEDIAYVFLTDRKSGVLAHTFQGGFPKDLLTLEKPDPGEPWKHQLLDTVEQGFVHDITVPILDGKVGYVHIGISEHRIDRTIAKFTLALVAIAGIVLVVAVISAAVLSWVLTQPIRSLIRAARRIRDGDLDQHVIPTTKDEIGDLVESFNQMSSEIVRHHKILDERSRRIRTAQEQAAWERDKLRAIIDSMVEGVVFVDAEGKISLCNGRAEEIWDVKADELLGKSLLQCHPKGAEAQVDKIIEQAKTNPGFTQSHAMEAPKGDCLSSYSSVHSQDGRYLGIVLLSLDISDRVALERQQEQLREQLFQQEKMVLVGQIAASVAHELNTPLSTVLLRAQLMEQQIGDTADSSDLQVIQREILRCRSIIDSLLGFSRQSEGATARADVVALVKESLALLKRDLTNKQISVRAQYSQPEITIWADSNQIQQVLVNLIANAADAMPNGGEIDVNVQPSEDYVEIRIADDGCGMTPEILQKALQPFFTTKERGKGTGLGLPICQRIVQEHGGKMDIQTEPQKGTTVCIRLPQSAPETSANE